MSYERPRKLVKLRLKRRTARKENSGDVQRLPFKDSAEHWSLRVCEDSRDLGKNQPKGLDRTVLLTPIWDKEQCLSSAGGLERLMVERAKTIHRGILYH